MSRLIALLFLLSYSVPLLALLLVSLGLVVLKRKSGLPAWLARLAAPPFYLVSLPIATLIVGAETLGWYSLLLLLGIHRGFFFEHLLDILPIFVFWLSFDPGHYLLVAFVFFVGFWTATFISGYLLWGTIWREKHHQPTSRLVDQLPRGLLLLILFGWGFFYLISYIARLTVPPIL